MLSWCHAAILCALTLPAFAEDQPPSIPKNFAGHAEFETTVGFKHAGWGCLVTTKTGSSVFLLTVRRLLGPEGGFAKQIPAADMGAFVRNITIDSFSAGSNGYFVSSIPMPTAGANPSQTPADDLAAYVVRNGAGKGMTVSISDKTPAPGTVVWLMTRDPGANALAASAATVSGNDGGWLTIQLKSGALESGSAGAPVLDVSGELVGIYSHKAKSSAGLDLIPADLISQTLAAQR
jgi:hypothetical protein